MYRSIRSLALLSVLAALIWYSPVAAQTPAASPQASPATTGLTGLIEGVSRQYTPDPTAIPAEHPDEFSLITAHIFRFGSAEQAASAWQSLRENAAQQMQLPADAGVGKLDIKEEERENLGDQAYVVWLSANPEENVTGYFRAVYVQEGDLLYLITAIGGNEEATLRADDLARAIAEREAGSEAVTFNPDGTSTGGLWDKFPGSDDEVVEGLVAFQDEQVAAGR
jgi:plasmid stabilization system protein ParE